MKLFGSLSQVSFSPIVTIEPRRRKFHRTIELRLPLPAGYSAQSEENLRLFCSIEEGQNRADWKDMTESVRPLALDYQSMTLLFPTTISARYWLVHCARRDRVSQLRSQASELYRHLIRVPFMAKFVIFAKRRDINEASLRVFCMTDDREERTLEVQEHYSQVAKSRDVEVVEGQTMYLEFGGNLEPIGRANGNMSRSVRYSNYYYRSSSSLISDQLNFVFHAFQENRLAFAVRLKELGLDAAGRVAFVEDSMKYLSSLNAQQRDFLYRRCRRAICTLGLQLPQMCVNYDNILGTPKRNSYYASARIGALSLADIATLLEEPARASGGGYASAAHEAPSSLGSLADSLNGSGGGGGKTADWPQLAPKLGIPRDELEFIVDYCANQREHASLSPALILLMHWFKLSSPEDRDQDLARALVAIGRGDIAERLNFTVEPKKMSRSTMELLREIEMIPVRSGSGLLLGPDPPGYGGSAGAERPRQTTSECSLEARDGSERRGQDLRASSRSETHPRGGDHYNEDDHGYQVPRAVAHQQQAPGRRALGESRSEINVPVDEHVETRMSSRVPAICVIRGSMEQPEDTGAEATSAGESSRRDEVNRDAVEQLADSLVEQIIADAVRSSQHQAGGDTLAPGSSSTQIAEWTEDKNGTFSHMVEQTASVETRSARSSSGGGSKKQRRRRSTHSMEGDGAAGTSQLEHPAQVQCSAADSPRALACHLSDTSLPAAARDDDVDSQAASAAAAAPLAADVDQLQASGSRLFQGESLVAVRECSRAPSDQQRAAASEQSQYAAQLAEHLTLGALMQALGCELPADSSRAARSQAALESPAQKSAAPSELDSALDDSGNNLDLDRRASGTQGVGVSGELQTEQDDGSSSAAEHRGDPVLGSFLVDPTSGGCSGNCDSGDFSLSTTTEEEDTTVIAALDGGASESASSVQLGNVNAKLGQGEPGARVVRAHEQRADGEPLAGAAPVKFGHESEVEGLREELVWDEGAGAARADLDSGRCTRGWGCGESGEARAKFKDARDAMAQEVASCTSLDHRAGSGRAEIDSTEDTSEAADSESARDLESARNQVEGARDQKPGVGGGKSEAGGKKRKKSGDLTSASSESSQSPVAATISVARRGHEFVLESGEATNSECSQLPGNQVEEQSPRSTASSSRKLESVSSSLNCKSAAQVAAVGSGEQQHQHSSTSSYYTTAPLLLHNISSSASNADFTTISTSLSSYETAQSRLTPTSQQDNTTADDESASSNEPATSSEMVSFSVEDRAAGLVSRPMSQATGVSSDAPDTPTMTPNTDELDEDIDEMMNCEETMAAGDVGEQQLAEPMKIQSPTPGPSSSSTQQQDLLTADMMLMDDTISAEQLRRILACKRLSEGCNRFGSSFVTRKNSLHMIEELPPLTEGETMKHMSHHLGHSIDQSTASSGSSGSLRAVNRPQGLSAFKRGSQDENTSCSSSTSLERSPSRRRSSTVSQCSSVLSESARNQLNFDLSPDLPPDSTLFEANALSPTDLDRPASPEPSSPGGETFSFRPITPADVHMPQSPDSTLGDSNDNELMDERLARLSQSCCQQQQQLSQHNQLDEMESSNDLPPSETSASALVDKDDANAPIRNTPDSMARLITERIGSVAVSAHSNSKRPASGEPMAHGFKQNKSAKSGSRQHEETRQSTGNSKALAATYSDRAQSVEPCTQQALVDTARPSSSLSTASSTSSSASSSNRRRRTSVPSSSLATARRRAQNTSSPSANSHCSSSSSSSGSKSGATIAATVAKNNNDELRLLHLIQLEARHLKHKHVPSRRQPTILNPVRIRQATDMTSFSSKKPESPLVGHRHSSTQSGLCYCHNY